MYGEEELRWWAALAFSLALVAVAALAGLVTSRPWRRYRRRRYFQRNGQIFDGPVRRR